jgi:hypothetical protein
MVEYYTNRYELMQNYKLERGEKKEPTMRKPLRR